MKKILSFATILLISGCSAINPFASNKPKMQEAPEVISQNQNQYQILWQQDIGQADKNNHLILSPALVETLDAIFVAKNSSNGKIK